MSHTSPGRRGTTTATLAVVALVVAVAVGGLWWLRQDDGPTAVFEDRKSGVSQPRQDGSRPDDEEGGRGDGSDGNRSGGEGSEGDGTDGSEADAALGERAEDIAAQDFPDDPRVVVISVDGLGSPWVSQESTPTLATLLAQGAGTLNARTAVEKTVTLPNHTGMVTGRRVDAASGGHGVTWNHTSSGSVAPGTESVFTVIDEADGTSAVFAGKAKFEMWGRAWPGAIDELVIKKRQPALVTAAIRELRNDDHHDLVLLHLAGPDSAGHDSGWGSPSYVDAVTRADADVERVVSAILGDDDLAEDVVLVVTADHGGLPGTAGHSDTSRPVNYTIPFVVWGPGIQAGDLYTLNPDYEDPGTGQPAYDEPPPVRNGDVANLVTDLLGLGPVPGSEFDAGHELDVE
ncbi:alkaline phosphatase family protein [Nocardioides antri]|uniref:Sulfatase-like hydrolase/transferase n=1 Tax=Nocardioides antri TaxID=2607659 RepID=A0A5B1M518_9ACTN|nr:alkaline phosphatase family protein [Nocardioides antri]KAA1427558.1 sulfatase-like hydrolase/transferase [Nocardioides antri]